MAHLHKLAGSYKVVSLTKPLTIRQQQHHEPQTFQQCLVTQIKVRNVIIKRVHPHR